MCVCVFVFVYCLLFQTFMPPTALKLIRRVGTLSRCTVTVTAAENAAALPTAYRNGTSDHRQQHSRAEKKKKPTTTRELDRHSLLSGFI